MSTAAIAEVYQVVVMRAFDAHIFVHPFSSSLIKERERRRRRITRYKQDEEADTRRLATRPSDHQEEQEQEQGTGKGASTVTARRNENGRRAGLTSRIYHLPLSGLRLPIGVRVGAAGDLVLAVPEPLPRGVPPPARPGPPRRRGCRAREVAAAPRRRRGVELLRLVAVVPVLPSRRREQHEHGAEEGAQQE